MGEAEYQEAAPIPGIERNTHNVFRYRALERSTTFRVLHLHPGREAEPLRGELGHFDLDSPDPLSYEALSYVWGKPKYERCLTTTDGIILLTPNLEVALKRLRRPDQTRYVWADGVCINQSDIQERGHQVKLMKSIYSASKRVIVWLGP
ncbi:HET-domain-containing protein, partial [Trematosphaeria pertusa]